MAEKTKAEKEKERKAKLKGVMAGLAAQSGGHLASAMAAPCMIQEMFAKPYFPDQPLWLEDPSMYRKAKAIEKHLHVPEKLVYKTTGEFSPFYDPEQRAVYLTHKSLPALAHEIGHASKSHLISPLAKLMRRYPFAYPLGIGGALGLALSENETAQNLAPVVGIAPYVPQLAEEGRASIQGIRAIRATQGLKEAIKSLTTLGPYFATYIAGALGPAFLAPWIAKSVKKHYASKDQEKTAQPKGGTQRLFNTSRKAWAAPAPKPKTTQPKANSSKPDIPKPAKLPSKTKYYKDMLESLYNPSRGFRYV
jgi:hypothetical protein